MLHIVEAPQRDERTRLGFEEPQHPGRIPLGQFGMLEFAIVITKKVQRFLEQMMPERADAVSERPLAEVAPACTCR